MGIRLQERDMDILQDLYRFNGLSGQAIVRARFSKDQGGYRRLKILEKHNFIAKKYYYAVRRAGERTWTQRIAAIYYLTPKGLRTIGESIDPRMVRPDEDKLDVHNLIGKLYLANSGLLSKRETLKRYDLKGFMPVTCSFPSDPPIFVHILGKKNLEESTRIVSFAQAKILPARHIIVSRSFEEEFLVPEISFIPWEFAPEVLPVLAQDFGHYLNGLKTIVKSLYPEAVFTPHGLFTEAQTRNKTYNLAELVSGSCYLRLELRTPPPNTVILVKDKRCLEGVQLDQGSFTIYNMRDQSFYEVFLDQGRMYMRPVIF